MRELPDDYGTPQYDARWMREKLNLPAESPTRDMQGALHVVCHEAHGYDAYIKSHKCNDKQGEIARLTVCILKMESKYERCRAALLAIAGATLPSSARSIARAALCPEDAP